MTYKQTDINVLYFFKHILQPNKKQNYVMIEH